MKVELLSNADTWVTASSGYRSKKELSDSYPHLTFVTETNNYKYYANNSGGKILFRVAKPPKITRAKAEEKYGIEITD